jgi:4'-phosphopantetheinyl transferase
MNDKTNSWLAPDDIHIFADEVHVWLVRLDETSLCRPCGESLLSAEEKERAFKFKFERDRRRHIVSHAALRSVLSTYLDLPPGSLKFAAGPNGKPKLAPIPGEELVQFNLSHANEVALIAVAREKEVGVDVEWIDRNTPFREIAGRFFSAQEVGALDALPTHLQKIAFFKCWTSKEAFLKAKGTGLSDKLDDVEILSPRQGVVRIKSAVPNWRLVELDPGDGYAGAVVFEGNKGEIQCYLWHGLKTTCPHRNS